MIYLGDNWPDKYRGTFFTNNMHGNRVNNDRLVPNASTYVGVHGDDFLFGNDPWFRGMSIKYGPDGGVYISDWHDFGECHDSDGSHRLCSLGAPPPRAHPPVASARTPPPAAPTEYAPAAQGRTRRPRQGRQRASTWARRPPADRTATSAAAPGGLLQQACHHATNARDAREAGVWHDLIDESMA